MKKLEIDTVLLKNERIISIIYIGILIQLRSNKVVESKVSKPKTGLKIGFASCLHQNKPMPILKL